MKPSLGGEDPHDGTLFLVGGTTQVSAGEPGQDAKVTNPIRTKGGRTSTTSVPVPDMVHNPIPNTVPFLL